MKLAFSLLGVCTVLAASVTTYAFDLKDSAILGEYTLAKPDAAAEIQRAELIYNTDNQLIVRVDRGQGDYELTGPDKEANVFKGEDEVNCDGDESACSYDSATVIKLLSTKDASGKLIPQIAIDITLSYAWAPDCGGQDENGDDQPACEDEKLTYILNWNKALDYSIPFYTNFRNPPLKKFSEDCNARLHAVLFETAGTRYSNSYEICGAESSFQYRDSFEVAFPYFLKAWLGRNQLLPKEITANEAAALFDQATTVAKTYKAPGEVTSAMIVEELEKLKAYALKFDRFYILLPTEKFANDAELYIADTKSKTIVKLTVKFK